MKLYKSNKKVSSIKNNPEQFLNGITANSMDAPRNAFVNVHGKIIATFDQVKISAEEYYIVLESEFVDAVLSHIDKFVKLSGANVQQLSKNVYFALEGDCPHSGADPNEIAIPQKKGSLIITAQEQEQEANVSEDEFTLFRLGNNIPLHGVDFKDDFLLNVSEEEFVSYTKGCFLGQEPISKVHNRSKPTWRLVVKYEIECSDEEKTKMTSKMTDPQTNRIFGFVFERNS